MKIKCTCEKDYSDCIENHSDKIIIIKFSANWCGPCKKLSPLVEKISDSRDDIVLLDVDVDTNSELCNKFNVKGIPHCLVKYKETETKPVVGFKPNDLVETLQKVIKEKETNK